MPSLTDINDFIKKNGLATLFSVFLALLLWKTLTKLDEAQDRNDKAEARTRAAMEKCVTVTETEHKHTRAVIRMEATSIKASVALDGGMSQ